MNGIEEHSTLSMAFQGMNIAKLRQAVLEIRESVVGDLSLTMPTASSLYSSCKAKVPGSGMGSKNLTAVEVFSIPEIALSVFHYLDPGSLLKLELVAKVFRDCEYLNYNWLELCKVKWYVDMKVFQL